MDPALQAVQPYCGTPPDPAEIWTRWRLDPAVLAVLAAIWLWYVIGYLRARRLALPGAPGRVHGACFHAGWLLATLALVSPLCPLSVSLFAARATQHVVLTVIAAPLAAAGYPLRTCLLAFASAQRSRIAPARCARMPLAAAGAFAIALWIWHMPAPYAATFASVAIYWTMHATLFACATWLWTCLLDDARYALVGGLFASLGSAIQMGLLGALITLAPQPWYSAHLLTADAWGLSPLQDQQLGGAIMWVVGGTAFFLVAMVGIARALADRRQPVPLAFAPPARPATQRS
jgi:putative membrane protein